MRRSRIVWGALALLALSMWAGQAHADSQIYAEADDGVLLAGLHEVLAVAVRPPVVIRQRLVLPGEAGWIVPLRESDLGGKPLAWRIEAADTEMERPAATFCFWISIRDGLPVVRLFFPEQGSVVPPEDSQLMSTPVGWDSWPGQAPAEVRLRIGKLLDLQWRPGAALPLPRRIPHGSVLWALGQDGQGAPAWFEYVSGKDCAFMPVAARVEVAIEGPADPSAGDPQIAVSPDDAAFVDEAEIWDDKRYSWLLPPALPSEITAQGRTVRLGAGTANPYVIRLLDRLLRQEMGARGANHENPLRGTLAESGKAVVFHLRRGDYLLEAESTSWFAVGKAPAIHVAATCAGTQVTVSGPLRIDPGRTLEGIVVDLTGARLPRIQVAAYGDPVLTDADGHFRFAHLPPDEPVRGRVWGEGIKPIQIEDWFAMEPPVVVTVSRVHDLTVLLPDGAAAEAVRVWLRAPGRYTFQAQFNQYSEGGYWLDEGSDEAEEVESPAGTLIFPDLEEGRWGIRLDLAGYEPFAFEADIPASEPIPWRSSPCTDGEIVLLQGGAGISNIVTLVPWPASPDKLDPWEMGSPGRWHTDAGGRVRAPCGEIGQARAIGIDTGKGGITAAVGLSGASGRYGIELPDPASVELEVRPTELPYMVEVKWRFLVAPDLETSFGGVLWTRVPEDGFLELTGLWEGRWRITAKANGKELGRQDLDLRAGRNEASLYLTRLDTFRLEGIPPGVGCSLDQGGLLGEGEVTALPWDARDLVCTSCMGCGESVTVRYDIGALRGQDPWRLPAGWMRPEAPAGTASAVRVSLESADGRTRVEAVRSLGGEIDAPDPGWGWEGFSALLDHIPPGVYRAEWFDDAGRRLATSSVTATSFPGR